jgi:hypothetical protein
MPRDKEIKRRDAANDEILDSIRNEFPDATLCEVKLIPRFSAKLIWDGFEGMPKGSSRHEYCRKAIGRTAYDSSFIRPLTKQEYADLLEERANPMD